MIGEVLGDNGFLEIFITIETQYLLAEVHYLQDILVMLREMFS